MSKTYNYNIIPEISDRIRTEAEISRILNQLIDNKNVLFLVPIILKILKINIGVLFPTWGFWGPEDPRILKWEKLEYCNT